MTKNKTIEIQTLHDERRDLFAAAALTGLLAANDPNVEYKYVDSSDLFELDVTTAFQYADAMIEASKKGDD